MESIYEEIEAAVIKKVIAAALARQMARQGVSVSALAEKLSTSRAVLNRMLDEATPQDNSHDALPHRRGPAAG